MVTDTLYCEIIKILGKRKNSIVTVLQAVCPQIHQGEALRKFVLDELGRDGFEGDLLELLKQHAKRNGTGRNTLQERGCHHE